MLPLQYNDIIAYYSFYSIYITIVFGVVTNNLDVGIPA